MSDDNRKVLVLGAPGSLEIALAPKMVDEIETYPTSEETMPSYKQLIKQNDFQCDVAMHLDDLTDVCHGLAWEAGWWHDLETGEPIERNDAELICLMHSELSEALEGVRKGHQDKHLPQYSAVTVELADAVVRILDYAGKRQLPIGSALAEKLAYNQDRADHSVEARKAEGGKKI